MPVRTGESAPYAPPATIMQIINGFRDRGLATPFTADVLVRAGVTESLVPRVLRSLEGLDLIDEKGSPTAEMEGLRRASTEEFRPRLEAIVRSVYAEVFQFTDPAKDPPTKIADAFRAYEPIGQRGRMVTLFLGLCEAAGIISEGAARKQAPGGNGRKKPDRVRKAAGAASVRTQSQARGAAPQTGASSAAPGLPPALTGLLASLPQDGRGWIKADRDKWVTVFTTVLDFAIPIVEMVASNGDDGDDIDE